MLRGLSIRNVVLIEHLFIDFDAGFCALTGETGAGKSILLDSLGLALGARSESGLVRKGQDQAQVSAEFYISDTHPVHDLLREQELDSAPDLVLRRIISADGRSRAFINDQPVSAGLLRQAGDMLVEIHGQFDTHGLLDAKNHRAMLDDYAGIDRSGLARLWDEWRAAQDALDDAQAEIEQARRDEDYLRQALEDLDGLAPEPGEEDKLAALRDRLMRRDGLIQALNAAYDAAGEAGSLIGQSARMLAQAGEEGGTVLAALDRADAEIQEAIAQIRSQSTDLEETDYSLTEIDDRLFALRGQARKHNCTVDELSGMRDEIARKLNNIEAQDDRLEKLAVAVEKAAKTYRAMAENVSVARRAAAEKLDRLVALELPPLKMDKARFETSVTPLPDSEWGAGGIDRVRFLVATNPGADAGALNKIASGGELSRFTLALKVVMAAAVGHARTMIFDEVDSGIGGGVAAAVGERLARLAQGAQVLVVTHAPQVAACATHHYIVTKQDNGATVTTTVIGLPRGDERREEIARMLAGAEVTAEARAAADRLLQTGT